MNKLLVIYLLLFIGCCKPLLLQAQIDRAAGDQQALDFLTGIPEFRELNFVMTEYELKSVISKHHLLRTIYNEMGRKFYHVYRQDGENVMVTFHKDRCSGIQRMPRDPFAGMYFLDDTPEFQEINLAVTEEELDNIISKNHLLKAVSGEAGHKFYRIFRQDGENVIVMFRGWKCSGIQRMLRGRGAVVSRAD
jgi:formylmethanofuran dehydrogenase subunit D